MSSEPRPCAPLGAVGVHVIRIDRLRLTLPRRRDPKSPGTTSALEVLAAAAATDNTKHNTNNGVKSEPSREQTIVLLPFVVRKGAAHPAARERALEITWATTNKGAVKRPLVADETSLRKVSEEIGDIDWGVDSILVEGTFSKKSANAFTSKAAALRLLVAPGGDVHAPLSQWTTFQSRTSIDLADALNTALAASAHMPAYFSRVALKELPGATLSGRMCIVDTLAARASAHLDSAAALFREADPKANQHLLCLLLLPRAGVVPIARQALDRRSLKLSARKRRMAAAAEHAAVDSPTASSPKSNATGDADESSDDDDDDDDADVAPTILKACELLRSLAVSRVSVMARADELTTLGDTLSNSIRVLHAFAVSEGVASAPVDEVLLKHACFELDTGTVDKAELPDDAAKLMGWEESPLEQIEGPLSGGEAVTNDAASEGVTTAGAKAKAAAIEVDRMQVPALPGGGGGGSGGSRDAAGAFTSALGVALSGIGSVAVEVGPRLPIIGSIIAAAKAIHGRLQAMEDMEELCGKVVVRIAVLLRLLQQRSVREAIFEDEGCKALLGVVYRHVKDARSVIEEYTKATGAIMRFLTTSSSLSQLETIHNDLTGSFTLLHQLVTTRTAAITAASARVGDDVTAKSSAEELERRVTDAIESQSVTMMAAIAETPASIDALAGCLDHMASTLPAAVAGAMRAQQTELKDALEGAIHESREHIVAAFKDIADAGAFDTLVNAQAQTQAYLQRMSADNATSRDTIVAAVRDSARQTDEQLVRLAACSQELASSVRQVLNSGELSRVVTGALDSAAAKKSAIAAATMQAIKRVARSDLQAFYARKLAHRSVTGSTTAEGDDLFILTEVADGPVADDVPVTNNSSTTTTTAAPRRRRGIDHVLGAVPRSKRFLLIEGRAGSGKTCMAHYLARKQVAPEGSCVLQLPLSDLLRGEHDKIDITPERLIELALTTWETRFTQGICKVSRSEMTAALLTMDRLVFVLDGFDEISKTSMSTLQALFTGIHHGTSQHLYVVTSRPERDYDPENEKALAEALRTGSSRFAVQPWNEAAQLAYVKRVFAHDTAAVHTLVFSLLRQRSLEAWLGLPLMCDIMCDYARSRLDATGNLTELEASFKQQTPADVLERGLRGLWSKRVPSSLKVSVEEAFSAMKLRAVIMWGSDSSMTRLHIAAEVDKECSQLDVALHKSGWFLRVDESTRAIGVQVKFAHRAFLEYFVACSIAEDADPGAAIRKHISLHDGERVMVSILCHRMRTVSATAKREATVAAIRALVQRRFDARIPNDVLEQRIESGGGPHKRSMRDVCAWVLSSEVLFGSRDLRLQLDRALGLSICAESASILGATSLVVPDESFIGGLFDSRNWFPFVVEPLAEYADDSEALGRILDWWPHGSPVSWRGRVPVLSRALLRRLESRIARGDAGSINGDAISALLNRAGGVVKVGDAIDFGSPQVLKSVLATSGARDFSSAAACVQAVLQRRAEGEETAPLLSVVAADFGVSEFFRFCAVGDDVQPEQTDPTTIRPVTGAERIGDVLHVCEVRATTRVGLPTLLRLLPQCPFVTTIDVELPPTSSSSSTFAATAASSNDDGAATAARRPPTSPQSQQALIRQLRDQCGLLQRVVVSCADGSVPSLRRVVGSVEDDQRLFAPLKSVSLRTSKSINFSSDPVVGEWLRHAAFMTTSIDHRSSRSYEMLRFAADGTSGRDDLAGACVALLLLSPSSPARRSNVRVGLMDSAGAEAGASPLDTAASAVRVDIAISFARSGGGQQQRVAVCRSAASDGGADDATTLLCGGDSLPAPTALFVTVAATSPPPPPPPAGEFRRSRLDLTPLVRAHPMYVDELRKAAHSQHHLAATPELFWTSRSTNLMGSAQLSQAAALATNVVLSLTLPLASGPFLLQVTELGTTMRVAVPFAAWDAALMAATVQALSAATLDRIEVELPRTSATAELAASFLAAAARGGFGTNSRLAIRFTVPKSTGDSSECEAIVTANAVVSSAAAMLMCDVAIVDVRAPYGHVPFPALVPRLPPSSFAAGRVVSVRVDDGTDDANMADLTMAVVALEQRELRRTSDGTADSTAPDARPRMHLTLCFARIDAEGAQGLVRALLSRPQRRSSQAQATAEGAATEGVVPISSVEQLSVLHLPTAVAEAAAAASAEILEGIVLRRLGTRGAPPPRWLAAARAGTMSLHVSNCRDPPPALSPALSITHGAPTGGVPQLTATASMGGPPASGVGPDSGGATIPSICGRSLDVEFADGAIGAADVPTVSAPFAASAEADRLSSVELRWTKHNDNTLRPLLPALCAERTSRLRHLAVSFVAGGGITDSTLQPIVAANAPQLVSLDVSWSGGGVTDRCFGSSGFDDATAHHSSAFGELEELSVRGTQGKITDRGLAHVVTRAPKLRHLAIGWTRGAIGDDTVTSAATSAKSSLVRLDVAGTAGAVTDAGLREIARRCRQLEAVDVSATAGGVTIDGVRAIIESCLLLHTLDVGDTAIDAGAVLRLLCGRRIPAAAHPGGSVRACQFKRLGLRCTTGATAEDVAAFVEHAGSTLEHLDLCHAGPRLVTRGVWAALDAADCPALQFLDVTHVLDGDITAVETSRRAAGGSSPRIINGSPVDPSTAPPHSGERESLASRLPLSCQPRFVRDGTGVSVGIGHPALEGIGLHAGRAAIVACEQLETYGVSIDADFAAVADAVGRRRGGSVAAVAGGGGEPAADRRRRHNGTPPPPQEAPAAAASPSAKRDRNSAASERVWTPLRQAAATRNADYVSAVTTLPDDPQAALRDAARSGASVVIEVLIARGADVTPTPGGVPPRPNESLLHLAAGANSPDAIDALCNSGGLHADAVASDGTTAMFAAAAAGARDAIGALMKHGANKDFAVGPGYPDAGATPLFDSIGSKQLGALDALLQLGVKAVGVRVGGWTPLMLAASVGWADGIAALYRQSPEQDLDARATHTEDTAMCIAAAYGQHRSISTLSSLGASITAPNRTGEAPVLLAAARGMPIALSTLLALGAPAASARRDGQTAMAFAHRAGRAECVELLRSHGVALPIQE